MNLHVCKEGLVVQLRGPDLQLLSPELKACLAKYSVCRYCGIPFSETPIRCEAAPDKLKTSAMNRWERWIADYMVAHENDDYVTRIIQNNRDALQRKGQRLVRLEKVPGETGAPEEFQSWLADLYPGVALEVAALSIAPVPEPPKRHTRKLEDFRAAFKVSDSLQHGYLKWFAWNWLEAEGCKRIGYELTYTLWVPQEYSQLYTPRLIRNSPIEHDMHVVADVAGGVFTKGVSLVECGMTSTKNLILPLIAETRADSVTWIPFVTRDRGKHWSDFDNDIPAFKIRLRQ